MIWEKEHSGLYYRGWKRTLVNTYATSVFSDLSYYHEALESEEKADTPMRNLMVRTTYLYIVSLI